MFSGLREKLVELQRSGTFWRCLLVLTDHLLKLCGHSILGVGMACQLSSCEHSALGEGMAWQLTFW
jgi:hypothetical protein